MALISLLQINFKKGNFSDVSEPKNSEKWYQQGEVSKNTYITIFESKIKNSGMQSEYFQSGEGGKHENETSVIT